MSDNVATQNKRIYFLQQIILVKSDLTLDIDNLEKSSSSAADGTSESSDESSESNTEEEEESGSEDETTDEDDESVCNDDVITSILNLTSTTILDLEQSVAELHLHETI